MCPGPVAASGRRRIYHADLIGLRAELLLAEDGGPGQPLGTVCAVEDFGAGR